jgi:hypothetical protein
MSGYLLLRKSFVSPKNQQHNQVGVDALYKQSFKAAGRILIMNRLTVFCDLAGGRRMGKIVKLNDYTVRVKIMKGARTFFVTKRHIKKHNCFFFTKGA